MNPLEKQRNMSRECMVVGVIRFKSAAIGTWKPSSHPGEVLFLTTRVRPTSRPFHLTHARGSERPKWCLMPQRHVGRMGTTNGGVEEEAIGR